VTPTLALQDYLRARRSLVDDHLSRWLIAPPACPPIISEAMRYSLLGGGKRFRPLLALAAGDAIATHTRAQAPPDHATCDEDVARLVMPAACALEMIHTYSLIHDDLPAMDNDTLRRGRPTLHVVHGEGMAILAGDGLLTEAFALLASRPASDSAAVLGRRLRTLAEVADAAGAAGMVGGQAIDLQAVGSGTAEQQAVVPLSFDALRDMHARKTGALIRASAVAGAIMAGGTNEAVEAIRSYAVGLGLAFQIVDDILDVEGATADLGKTAGKDAAAGKATYPALFGLERSRALAAEAMDQALGALRVAGLDGGRLDEIARWVTDRRA
jgi:geranylgeranyl diphosphate synthase, type II